MIGGEPRPRPPLATAGSDERPNSSPRTPLIDEEVFGGVRSLPGQMRALLDESSVNSSLGRAHTQRRPSPGSLTAIERLMCVRDLIHATADHLERLTGALRPVRARCQVAEPIGGYHRWDPDEIISVLSAESERLAGMAETLAADDRLPAGVRDGLALIMAELLGHVVAETAEQLAQAELTLRSFAMFPSGGRCASGSTTDWFVGSSGEPRI